MQPAIFLDRDNTLILNEGDLGDPAAVRLREDVAQGLRRLRDAGYRLIVVTNQAGVARGRFTESDVDAVHQRIAELVDQAAQTAGLIDRFYYCPYHPEATVPAYLGDHPWRKPHPGMLLQAAHDLGVDLSQSWMIGDQQRDIAAGRSAGCRTVLLSTDEATARDAQATYRVESFQAAVATILQDQAEARMKPSPNGIAPGSASPRAVPAEPDLQHLRRTMGELVEELRAVRMRRTEFTTTRMAAAASQLLVLLLALLGMLQLSQPQAMLPWLAGAVLLQLFTIALLVLDLRT